MAITVQKIQPNIGADVTGVDIRRATDDEIAAIRAALITHGVIVFRNQPMTQDDLVVFGRRFAELIPPVTQANEGEHPEVHKIFSDGIDKSGAADIWHADLTCFPRPSSGSVLQALVIPSMGGDTLWSSGVAAYNGLPEGMKTRIENLIAVHDVRRTLARKAEPDQIEAMAARIPPSEHPVVRVHPETGERILYVNDGFTDHIVGMDTAESDALLAYLFDRFKIPENQVRLKWQSGTIAFWDNRKVQHYAVADYSEPRHMQSVVLLDDVPFGPASERAHALAVTGV